VETAATMPRRLGQDRVRTCGADMRRPLPRREAAGKGSGGGDELPQGLRLALGLLDAGLHEVSDGDHPEQAPASITGRCRTRRSVMRARASPIVVRGSRWRGPGSSRRGRARVRRLARPGHRADEVALAHDAQHPPLPVTDEHGADPVPARASAISRPVASGGTETTSEPFACRMRAIVMAQSPLLSR
jgi:hypothetical protein